MGIRFNPTRGSLDHEHQWISAGFEMWLSTRGVPSNELRKGSSFRRSRLFLPGLASVPGIGFTAHGGGPMAALAPSCCDCAPNFDLSESDGAIYIRAVARLLSIARKTPMNSTPDTKTGKLVGWVLSVAIV